MITIDEQLIAAPAAVCFRIAADVERWPDILPHYRWVRFHQKTDFGHGVVEMSAWREFPLGIKYPTWWVSQMRSAPNEPAVYYKHVDGITRGMDVKWELQPRGEQTFIRLFHTWDGPAWPLISTFAANYVIGPQFVSAIAQRTLAGVAREAERITRKQS
ncbi:MAG TPA: SRPBCC family protein [Longimicrobiales bacterium]|nr:SRPBCC family protein [Longimicrobiales bacterium]